MRGDGSRDTYPPFIFFLCFSLPPDKSTGGIAVLTNDKRQDAMSNLTLTRYEGETVMIGDDIEIYVSMIGRSQVKLSFNVPREIRILRGELYDNPEEKHDDTR